MGFHISLVGALAAYVLIGSHLPQWGEKNGGGMGSVAVNPVATIPLPSRAAPPNPVANPTESQVPAPPPKAKVQPKVRQPEPDAIPLKSKTPPKPEKKRIEASAPNKFREQEKDVPNQAYSTHDRAVSSPMFQMPGAGGVNIGTDSPLGQQFGWYAKLITDKVGQNWKTADLAARSAPAAVVSFTIRRDGSLAPGSVKVDQSSGVLQVDLSAQRAVLDAAPFAALPTAFNRNEAQIQLRFELRR
ncbi:MAG TPA: TonB family protein [Verrucomicrobiaceae bacterium]